jgi:hypothetical protein
MEFFRRDFMIKMDHPIAVPRHFPHQIRLFFVQDSFIQETSGDFLVFGGGKSKAFGQDMSADIE